MIGVIDVLVNDASVAARVSARIYPIERQQGSALPALSVDVTDIDPSDTKDGVSTLDEEFTSVTSYADTYNECVLLAGECRSALDRYAGTNQGVVIQQSVYLNEFQNKANINNKKVFFIEQNYKVRIIR